MKSMMKRTTVREIRHSFGRFFAIFAIIALGVGFFSGVRITTPTMVNTVNEFLRERQFFDYRLISSIGWDEESVGDIRAEILNYFAHSARIGADRFAAFSAYSAAYSLYTSRNI